MTDESLWIANRQLREEVARLQREKEELRRSLVDRDKLIQDLRVSIRGFQRGNRVLEAQVAELQKLLSETSQTVDAFKERLEGRIGQ